MKSITIEGQLRTETGKKIYPPASLSGPGTWCNLWGFAGGEFRRACVGIQKPCLHFRIPVG